MQSCKNGRAAVVAAGSNHNLLITRRGEIFAWGLSSSGELGQRDTPIDQPWPIQVAPRPDHLSHSLESVFIDLLAWLSSQPWGHAVSWLRAFSGMSCQSRL